MASPSGTGFNVKPESAHDQYLNASFHWHSASTTAALVDIDGIKVSHDTRGHHIGDEVLRVFAVPASCFNRLGQISRAATTNAQVEADWRFADAAPASLVRSHTRAHQPH
jgi:predicted signal transduction protein with EAL and GGDEF domain